MPHPDSEFDALKQLCGKRISRWYVRKNQTEAKARLEHECSLILEYGHATALQAAVKLVRRLIRNKIFFRLVGAGPCSLLNFLLGLSEIDPLRFNLPAERVLIPNGISFTLLVDAEQEDRVLRWAGEEGSDENFCIHTATESDMMLVRVANHIRERHDREFDLRGIPPIDPLTGKLLVDDDLAAR